MWNRWLEFVGKRSGPDLYLFVAFFGAMGFGFGSALGAEEAVGGLSVLAAIVVVGGSRTLARRKKLDAYQVQPGTSVCFACRGMFAEQDLRKLSRYIAVLGPVTYVDRQNDFCQRCARRQHALCALYLILVLIFVGGYVLALVESMGSNAR